MAADLHTRLVLPVPELYATVPGAHIDLLAPFLEVESIEHGVVAELREFFADLTPFGYVLGDPVESPGGRRYLPPQPVGIFRRITHSLRRTFPEVVGPSTSLDTVVPHLFLPEATEVPTPLEVHAREAWLVHGHGPPGLPDTDTTTLATFGFGTSAA